MPTRQQLSTIIDIFVELASQANGASYLLKDGDQDYYTKRTSDLLDSAREQIEEGIGYLRMTQAGLPIEQRTSPGYNPSATDIKKIVGRERDPSTATTVRPPRANRLRPKRPR